MSFTAADVQAEFDRDEASGEYAYEEFQWMSPGESIEFGKFGIARMEDSKIGGEGYGDRPIWYVFSLVDGGRTRRFKREGVYASFKGREWENHLVEVELYEKKVLRYRRV